MQARLHKTRGNFHSLCHILFHPSLHVHLVDEATSAMESRWPCWQAHPSSSLQPFFRFRIHQVPRQQEIPKKIKCHEEHKASHVQSSRWWSVLAWSLQAGFLFYPLLHACCQHTFYESQPCRWYACWSTCQRSTGALTHASVTHKGQKRVTPYGLMVVVDTTPLGDGAISEGQVVVFEKLRWLLWWRVLPWLFGHQFLAIPPDQTCDAVWWGFVWHHSKVEHVAEYWPSWWAGWQLMIFAWVWSPTDEQEEQSWYDKINKKTPGQLSTPSS